MGTYFVNMKETIKIEKEFESSGTEEESSQAMKILRPGALGHKTSSKFKEILAERKEKRNQAASTSKVSDSKLQDLMSKTFFTEKKERSKILSQNELLKRHQNLSYINNTIDLRETYQTSAISNSSTIE